MSKRASFVIGLFVIVSLVLTACGGGAATPAPTAEPTQASSDKVQIRWYVGLGTGTNPDQVDVENQVVEAFNASQDKIELVIEIVDNTVGAQTLQTQIASGDPPDIVGPVGTRGANAFAGLFLDLQPYVDKTGYDLSIYDPAAVEFYRNADGLLGLPYAVYPSFLYYNRDLFDEAGLPYPPHKVGEQYEGQDWTVDTLAELGQKLTVDASGNDATSPDFDPDNTVQFGFVSQWTENDPRAEWTLFGAGSFADGQGKAVISDEWRAAADWFYSGMWDKHFIPSQAYIDSDLLAAGNPFNSGNMAMAQSHLWYTCCLGDVANWDIAVLPAHNGAVTAKLHADTFRVLNTTEHPDEAFEVLTYLLGSKDLLQVYGAMPAEKSLQDEFFATLGERYTQGVDWQVAIDMLSYADNPSHESNLPNFLKADERDKAFGSLYSSQTGLDLDAEIATLLADLQAIFDEAK